MPNAWYSDAHSGQLSGIDFEHRRLNGMKVFVIVDAVIYVFRELCR